MERSELLDLGSEWMKSEHANVSPIVIIAFSAWFCFYLHQQCVAAAKLLSTWLAGYGWVCEMDGYGRGHGYGRGYGWICGWDGALYDSLLRRAELDTVRT